MDFENNSVELATELTVAWLSNPNTRASIEEVPAFLKSMVDTMNSLAGASEPETSEQSAQEYTPAVSVRKSLASKDHIISMLDGKPYKSLRRHLNANGLTPAEYRTRYDLSAGYPMVAENYSKARREIARKTGLGRKSTQSPASAAPATPGKKPVGRRRKSDAIAQA